MVQIDRVPDHFCAGEHSVGYIFYLIYIRTSILWTINNYSTLYTYTITRMHITHPCVHTNPPNKPLVQIEKFYKSRAHKTPNEIPNKEGYNTKSVFPRNTYKTSDRREYLKRHTQKYSWSRHVPHAHIVHIHLGRGLFVCGVLDTLGSPWYLAILRVRTISFGTRVR